MPSATSSPESSGFLQSIERQPGGSYLIVDQVHGEYTIEEPLLCDLLEALAVRRLKNIYQHGITGLLGFTPPVTRLEHSIGAMLIVRRAGGSLEEQAFGLLHDVSHTALSHVVDWALSEPGTSYHEVHMERYVTSTGLPDILKSHGLQLPGCMDESSFPLVEQPSPHLCADRLDYALRDAVAFGKLSQSDAKRISDGLIAIPDITSPRRLLALNDEHVALVLARGYLALDRDVWSNPAHIDLYRRTGNIIRDVVRSGKLPESSLWDLADADFWGKLRDVASDEQREDMRRMAATVLETHKVDSLPPTTKVRTIDPDVCKTAESEPAPLSTLLHEYFVERQEYILSRKALMAS